MKFIKIFIVLLLPSIITAQSQYVSIAGEPGAFSRMGFGARGKGMANAMASITDGTLVSYYNPALIVYQAGNSFQTSYSFLSLDRSLNFLNFTRKFELGKNKADTSAITKRVQVAGVSVGIINAGVSEFDERDNQGIKTGTLSPFENQFFLGLANRFSEKLSLGISAKFYYAKLYDEITSTTFGIDIGAVYRYNEKLTFALAIIDINSKYKWDTTKIYDTDGSNTQDKFPLIKKLAVSYKFEEQKLLAAIEFEAINSETNFLRIGAEYNIFENLFIRGGVDNFNVSNTDMPVRPSFGFSYFRDFQTFIGGIDYAFVIEPYSAYDQHIVGVNINF